MIDVRPLSGRSDLGEFLSFPWRVYREYPAWIPPLLADQRRLLDRQRNSYFRESDGEFFLARRGSEVVGRIAAFEHRRHLAVHRDSVGFFGFFECLDDPAVANALLDTAEGWLRTRGLQIARGPANFTIYDEAGVLLDGFEHSPMAGMAYTPPYYAGLIERHGYGKIRDLFVHRVKMDDVDPVRLTRLSRLALRRRGIELRPLDPTSVESEAKFFEEVFADAWRDNWGSIPITVDEFLEYFRMYKAIIDPGLVWLASVDGEPAAFAVVMPNVNEALRRANGSLWPLGWWHLLRLRRQARSHRAFMIGVKRKFRAVGLPLLFVQRYHALSKSHRFRLLEFSWLLEDNREAIAFVEGLGGRRVQTLRLYDKRIA